MTRRPDGDRVKVMRLREIGFFEREIAERTGIPRGTVSSIVRQERLQRARQESGEQKCGVIPTWAR